MQRSPREAGFSLVELMIAMGVMIALTAVVMTYTTDSIRIATATNEMTEAQQSLRAAQDFIARDLVAVGDGMEDIKAPRLTKAFLNNHLTKAPATDTNNTLGVLGVVTSDDQVPAGTTVPNESLAGIITLLTGSDRLTIMKMDPEFNGGATISLAAGTVTNNGQTVTLPPNTNMTQFALNDIYFFTSGDGSAFGAVTGVDAATRVLSFTAGDRYGINQGVTTSPINVVVGKGTKAASMMRMLVTSYFVDSTGLLIRRVFGVGGGKGLADTVVAEHVVNLQFRYFLDQTDASGNVVAPATKLTTETEQGDVRQVEVAVTTETAHALTKGTKPQISMTGSMSVRGMQFNQHLQPNN
ncbi:MAG TPA: prepilin-type N-terminal cleavage/methylation domain-containing protein [Pyrinomonadaceae bacterium]|jgi:Tfp pilus assembly protein PilW|nr:prepilin-type N-terminal cleavage/methylation domain-containing protein [Pyrinomonadaceae bacterium]